MQKILVSRKNGVSIFGHYKPGINKILNFSVGKETFQKLGDAETRRNIIIGTSNKK